MLSGDWPMLLFFPDASWTLKPDFSTNHLVLVFFLANWLKQPGAHGKQLRLCQGLRIPGNWWSICSGEKKTPTFKSRNPWLSVTFHLFPLGEIVPDGCDPRMLLARWALQLRGCVNVSHLFLMQMRPWGLRPCVWSRHAFRCWKPDKLRKSPLKRERRRWHTRRGTIVKQGVERNGWNLLGNSGYQQEQHGHTRAKSVYSNYCISCDFSMRMRMPSAKIIGYPVTLLL